ncbi:dihydropteroate synthase-like protein [Desulfurococcus mucosus]|uniref:Dihydropteroate synthase-related protein n=1 Tax=Desulfurococcus mucosus (strain ATCC 35584 / DSM 2162 / JCM 9187 / O7/1) TaxID=765177 RepID=E8R9F0_DESM0|nr:dihydropteroate synthase-like protein [Desulfurococcus mucosus]ADV65126.1 dihydropteroate synthase-related protein [Desulfurococcus mucosus DSM 2162]
MKIALLTGRLAGEALRRLVAEVDMPGVEFTVIELPIPVAAMMSSEYLERELPRHMEELRGVDLVIAPGFTSGDLTRVSELVGKPVVKGVRYMYDIPAMIKALLDGVTLSPVNPADDVIALQRAERDKRLLEALKQEAQRHHYFTIGNPYRVYVSHVYPIVLHEIYVTGEGSLDHIVARAVKAVADGADIVVLGFSMGKPQACIREVIAEVKERTRRPVGVDAPDPGLLREAAGWGADLLMSFTYSALKELGEAWFPGDVGVVLVPEPGAGGQDSLRSLLEAYRLALEKGATRIILDPVLSPPLNGLTASLWRYSEVRRMLPGVPLLMGVGNITELMDADSIGVNALLASIGVEIGVEAYLTTEASVKTRGSTRELRRALDMCVIARRESRPPKDLSVSLLLMKDKRRRATSVKPRGVVVHAAERRRTGMDPAGFFKIHVDHESGNIVVEHYKPGGVEPDYTVIGSDPYAILAEIVERRLASMHDHFFYLGYELSKAYIALKTGKEYVQDEDLFHI